MLKESKIQKKWISCLLAALIALSFITLSAITAFAADTAEKSLSTPKLTSVSTTATGINISWKAVNGAEKYRVYYRIGSGNWIGIGDTTGASYTWTGAKSGTNYTFTVRCISGNGKSYTSDFDRTGKSIKYLATPKLTSVANGPYGVQITWGAVTGAEKYRVFYRIGNSAWTKIADTTATTYAWLGPVSGTNYTFTVRCINSAGTAYTSYFDSTGKSIKYIAAPKITAVSTLSAAIQIDWGKVAGATLYRVYYKTPSTDWTKIGETASTSYIWKGAKGGTNYTFTVRCLTSDAKSFASGYDRVGKSLTFLSSPKLNSVSAGNSGTIISWDKVSGAALYRVFYKTGSGNWTKIGDTASTSYTWTGATKGKNYAFTVRCVAKDGKTYVSGYDNTGKSLKTVATPVLSSPELTATGIKISWGSVAGVEKYRVFYKTPSTDWAKIADTTSTSYTWTGAKSGTNYTFTVRCVNTAGNAYTSGYDTAGKSIKYIAAPKLTSVSNGPNGIQVTWGAVSGAEKYRVFYRIGNSAWTKIADTTATTYAWLGPVSGTNYTFTVRCLNSAGNAYTSYFDSTGKSIKYIAAPKLSSVTASSKGITIKWNKVTGAELYKVFRKTAGGDWTAIGVTAYTDFIDMQAAKGKTYTYTVRCINKSQSAYTSGYDSVGKSATSISNPPTKNDMVAVAEKEVGYTGGKKVWTWAGYKGRVPWCNLFVTWCANQLGYYQSGRIPLIQWPRDSVKWFKERGLYKSPSYIPKPGDLIYFIQPGESQPYHVGIVEKYANGKVYTIEGNSMDVVRKKTFDHGHRWIYGYATPDYGHN